MDYITEYRNKLRTPEEAVKVVKSGDWIDYLTNVAFPELLDAALAERAEELTDVKIRGEPHHAADTDCRKRSRARAFYL